MNRLMAHPRRGGLQMLLVLAFLFAFTSVATAQNADLVVIKSTDSSTAAADTDVSYDISVSNISTEDSTPTNTLTDTIPAGMTFVSAVTPAGWDCTLPAAGSGGTITCTYDNAIPGGDSVVFNFVFHVNPNVPADTEIDNTASVSHGGTDPNSENNSSTATVTIVVAPPAPLAPHDVLISEFRLSGPGGDSDEYIELHCNRDTDCNISGMAIQSYDPGIEDNFQITFPPGTLILARQYLLIADFSEYSLFDYAFPDFDVSDPMIPDFFIDNQGIQLIGADEPIVIDSVGFIGGGNAALYIEGNGLQPATGARPADQYAYVRRRIAGPLQDDDNNATDFILVSVTGTAHPGIDAPPVLGAPGPQSSSSALSFSNAEFPNSLVEPANDAHVSPNRVRVGSGNSGTLSIRRSVTNNTNQTFDYIAFRVIDIPTLNSPNPTGARAQLRLVTSPDAESFENSESRTVNILGTILEYDAGCGCEPAQPNGGGLNSTVYANIDQLILPGQTVDVQFLLNVVTAGEYRFYVYVEAFPATEEEELRTLKRGQLSRAPRVSKAKTARRMINLKRSAKATAPAVKKPKPNLGFPTKSTLGPVQFWIPRPVINLPSASTPARAKRQKRKVPVRRRSSAALRAKLEAKYKADTPAAQD
jgi:uncharacterized repeat protein (TIGR01451 family)